jgi:hypothetical protein
MTMKLNDLGEWLKNNGGNGVALVGSLLTGNIPAAIAAGAALVSSATGTDDISKSLEAFKTDPQTLIKLKELAAKEEDSIRAHLQKMKELELTDLQKEQEQTQLTIRNADNAEDIFIRRTRPLQSWLSLIAVFSYIFLCYFNQSQINETIVGWLFALPLAYFGLRQVGKGIDVIYPNKK